MVTLAGFRVWKILAGPLSLSGMQCKPRKQRAVIAEDCQGRFLSLPLLQHSFAEAFSFFSLFFSSVFEPFLNKVVVLLHPTGDDWANLCCYYYYIRPYYILREFSHVFITTVYVPPSANAKDAANAISSHVIDLETSAPDALKIITGDFNHCSLITSIINYFQHAKCDTRKERILDQCYTNVKDAYTSVPLPPLGRSDHKIVTYPQI